MKTSFRKSNVLFMTIRLIAFVLIGYFPSLIGSEEISCFNNHSVKDVVANYFLNQEYRNQTTLCSIMNAKGSDKGGRHNYTTLYSKLFQSCKNEKLNIFELGLGTNYTDTPSNMGPNGIPGASLHGWSEYFPNASIFGADVDNRILFQNKRISTFYCDQRDPASIDKMFANNQLGISYDIIIEDGLHEYMANLTFLNHSISRLKTGGIYIVEDLLPATVDQFKINLEDFKKKYRYAEIVRLPKDNVIDNTVLIVQK